MAPAPALYAQEPNELSRAAGVAVNFPIDRPDVLIGLLFKIINIVALLLVPLL